MKELRDNGGYAELNVSSKNLRDQAARLEKVMGDVHKTIRRDARVEVKVKILEGRKVWIVIFKDNIIQNSLSKLI